jgi:hypothetical protein
MSPSSRARKEIPTGRPTKPWARDSFFLPILHAFLYVSSGAFENAGFTLWAISPEAWRSKSGPNLERNSRGRISVFVHLFPTISLQFRKSPIMRNLGINL